MTARPPAGDDGDGPGLTDPAQLAILAVGIAVAVWLLLGVGYSGLPSVPAAAGVTLYVLAGVEGWLAWYVRGRVRDGGIGMGGGRLHPIAVARVLVLAKASALLGACATGLWAGLLVFLLPRQADVMAARADLPGAVIGLIGAALLVVAALVLERSCRTPDDPDDELSDASAA